MSMEGPFQPMAVSASGLAAERLRMSVITKNIANAHVTRTPEGGPYRRQRVVFEAVLRDLRGGIEPLGGVRVREVKPDLSPFNVVEDPSHPDSVNGFVSYPNVDLATEMVDLVASARGYEANLAAMRTYRDMMESTLRITQ